MQDSKIVGEPPHVLLVVRSGDILILLRNCRVRPSNPLDQLVRLRRGDAHLRHQLRFALRVLQLVTFESPEFPRPLPTNTANASFCCFIKFARLSDCILCISPKRCCNFSVVTAVARNFQKVWMHFAPLPCNCACELVLWS